MPYVVFRQKQRHECRNITMHCNLAIIGDSAAFETCLSWRRSLELLMQSSVHAACRSRSSSAAHSHLTSIACSGDFGIGFFGLSHNMGGYLVQDHLGMDWLCFLCRIEVRANNACSQGAETSGMIATAPSASGAAVSSGQHECKKNTTLAMWPTDAYRRRVFLQPWGLYLIAEAGYLESLHIDALAGVINVTFGAADEHLISTNKLRVERPSELQHHQNVCICVLIAPSSPPGIFSSESSYAGQERPCRENIEHGGNQDSGLSEFSGQGAAKRRLLHDASGSHSGENREQSILPARQCT